MVDRFINDSDYMRKACQLALKAKGRTSPNPLVGAVIVKGRRIIAEGWHLYCGAEHAEIMALNKAGRNAAGCRMYVTLEPCHHYGRTPPCVERIIHSGIREVIIGLKDPNPLTNGRSIMKLRRSGIKTRVGILRDEVRTMNEAFIKCVTEKMPFVAAKCAQTVDGKIATAAGRSKWITSQVARRFARGIRDEHDAILVGINTVLKDDPRLSANKKTKQFTKIILDSSLRIPLNARLFRNMRLSDCIVATTNKAPQRKMTTLQKKGVQVVVCPRRGRQLDLKWLFRKFARQGIQSILIEGGPHVIGSALKAGLVDKMYIYVAPKIFGDQKALSSVAGMSIRHVNRAVRLKKLTLGRIGEDILVTGYV